MFIAYGFFGICAVILGFFVLRSKPVVSILLGVLTFPLVVLSGLDWRQALIDSGKDPTMLGYAHFPLPLILLIILAVTALICIAAGIFFMIRRKKK